MRGAAAAAVIVLVSGPTGAQSTASADGGPPAARAAAVAPAPVGRREAVVAAPQGLTLGPFCANLKRVLRTGADGFAALRGAALESRTERSRRWAGRLLFGDFDRCTASSSEALGDYYDCFVTGMRESEARGRFTTLSGLLTRCLPEWSWQPLRTDYGRSSGLSANRDGLRVTLTSKPTPNAWGSYDVALTVEQVF